MTDTGECNVIVTLGAHYWISRQKSPMGPYRSISYFTGLSGYLILSEPTPAQRRPPPPAAADSLSSPPPSKYPLTRLSFPISFPPGQRDLHDRQAFTPFLPSLPCLPFPCRRLIADLMSAVAVSRVVHPPSPTYLGICKPCAYNIITKYTADFYIWFCFCRARLKGGWRLRFCVSLYRLVCHFCNSRSIMSIDDVNLALLVFAKHFAASLTLGIIVALLHFP